MKAVAALLLLCAVCALAQTPPRPVVRYSPAMYIQLQLILFSSICSGPAVGLPPCALTRPILATLATSGGSGIKTRTRTALTASLSGRMKCISLREFLTTPLASNTMSTSSLAPLTASCAPSTPLSPSLTSVRRISICHFLSTSANLFPQPNSLTLARL